MEILVASSLLGLGFFLNKDKITSNNDEEPIYIEDTYHNNQIPEIKSKEQKLANKEMKLARKGTNIIPSNYNRSIINESNVPFKIRTKDNNLNDDIIISNLTGEKMNKKDFKHNNMVPFFGGTMKQNVDPNLNKGLLERHTGRFEHTKHKTEQEPLFKPEKNLTFINGTPNVDLKERFVNSNLKTNQLPFDKIRVAPGVGQGYNSGGKGGFHQTEINDLVRPKTVDELRAKNNQKETYEGRVLSGKKISKPTSTKQLGKVFKYRPKKFYANNPDRYFKTTGANLKPKANETFVMKYTNRQQTKEVMGSAKSSNNKPSKIPLFQKSNRNIYRKDGVRNAILTDKYNSQNKNSDYGKSSFNLPANERDVTQKRTHLNNLVTEVSAIIAPLTDIMKQTKKENMIGNSRPEGNMSIPNPSKLTVKDPNDIAKTTIKETTLVGDTELNLKGNNRTTVYDPNDVAKTTIKETLINNNRSGDMNGPTKLTCYDPNDIAKTTIKETTIDNKHDGAMKPHKHVPKKYLQDSAKVTIRNTTDNIDTNLNINPDKQVPKMKLLDKAKTTVRETTEDKIRTGNVDMDQADGYKTNPAFAPNTNRQFTSNYEYSGHADGDVGKGGGEGYLSTNYEAPNTHKQFTSNYEYSGNSNSTNKKSMVYDDKYNARLNINKEQISKGRKPTQNNVKVSAGEESYNVQVKKQISDAKFRVQESNRVINRPKGKEAYDLTIFKDQLSNNTEIERINPKILSAFKKNPYSQPLDSYQYS